MSILPGLFDHVAWADTRARDAILTHADDSPARAQATRLYARLAAAEHVCTRLEARAPVHGIWPDLSLDAAASLAIESGAGLRSIAMRGTDELELEVEYRNSASHAFRNRVADVVTHVALHGSYHRGQIALMARHGDGTPAVTDYTAFVRGAPLLRKGRHSERYASA